MWTWTYSHPDEPSIQAHSVFLGIPDGGSYSGIFSTEEVAPIMAEFFPEPESAQAQESADLAVSQEGLAKSQ